MLTEDEIRERAEYCYLVYLQLSRLRENPQAPPERYLDLLGRSSLQLADDAFIRSVVEEELKMGNPDGGLTYLSALFEGFAHAYCEVLERPLEEIRDRIPAGLRETLAAEMEKKPKKTGKKQSS